MTTSSLDRREAATAALGPAAQAVLDAYARALAGMDTEIDAVRAVARIRRAAARIAEAELSLLALSVMAGAPITPACDAAGVKVWRLRDHITAELG